MRPFMINFKDGMQATCNIDYNFNPKYAQVLDKLSKLIHDSYAISKGIVVGGYS